MKRLFILFFIMISINSYSKNMMIASAAGYKKPVQEIVSLYEKYSGKKIDTMFGNMGQVISFVRNSNEISFVLGDMEFLDNSGMEIKSYEPLGKGILAIAYKKGVKFSEASEILDDKVDKILVPDAKKAIYGKRAVEYLNKSEYYEKLKGKMMFVQTVPQVFSYLISGEGDLGFVNLTNALAMKNKIGGYIIPERDKYSDIVITLGVLKNRDREMESFLQFIKESEVRKILKKYGIGEYDDI